MALLCKTAFEKLSMGHPRRSVSLNRTLLTRKTSKLCLIDTFLQVTDS